MKGLVVALVLLAAGKIGYHEFMFRRATNEVIVAAYRERAVTACQRDAKGQSLLPAAGWVSPKSIKLLIGKTNLDVYIWQVDHALWDARFRNPYLFLAAGDDARTYCEFDIVHGAASVFRM